MIEQLIKFKGADWIGMIFGLISTYYLARGKRTGFLFGIIGGMGWVTFGFLTGSVAGVLANLCFITVNCAGYVRWKRNGSGAANPCGTEPSKSSASPEHPGNTPS